MAVNVGNTLRRVVNATRRRASLLTSRNLPLSRRLGSLLTRHANPAYIIEEMVRQDGENLAIEIDGWTFSVPVPEGPTGRKDRLRAFSQVLSETFVEPLLYKGTVAVKPGDTAFDVGAHIGTMSALLSRDVGPTGKVFAFEPVVADVMRGNVAANPMANVEVIPKAVGAEAGSVAMSVTATGIDNSIVHVRDWQVATRMVPIISLDEFVDERGLDRVDFIKMDIEGAEEMALEGARRTIERFKPAWSISSYHYDFSGERQHPKLVAILRKAGYTVDDIENYHIYAH